MRRSTSSSTYNAVHYQLVDVNMCNSSGLKFPQTPAISPFECAVSPKYDIYECEHSTTVRLVEILLDA